MATARHKKHDCLRMPIEFMNGEVIISMIEHIKRMSEEFLVKFSELGLGTHWTVASFLGCKTNQCNPTKKNKNTRKE